MKPLRIYLDTSVFGGCFDKEFLKDSVKIFEAAGEGRIIIVLGELVGLELKAAPEYVQALTNSVPPENIMEVEFNHAAKELQSAYLEAGILTPNSAIDAGHVATATIHRVDAIVSWNFKHIVQLEKMKLFNQVNLKNGYGFLEIVSPREVLSDE
jgi:predicted nucleic acid-binding protein